MEWKQTITIDSHYPGLKGRRIFVTTFLLSTMIHVIGITAFQGIIPRIWSKSKLRTYRVDFIRPPVKDMMKSSKENDPTITQTHTEPPVETEEATISLDTRDSTYHPYTKVIKQNILNHWIYPLSAQQYFIQGSLLIVFRLDRDGNLIDSSIARSSGYEILDVYALKAIRSADPFPSFPETIPVQFLNIHASFSYQLKFEP